MCRCQHRHSITIRDPLRRRCPGFSASPRNHGGLVGAYDEADTYVVQHDFMHLSFFQDDFREFVDTLTVALRQIEKANSPIKHIHPVVLKESSLFDVEAEGRP